jgi:hypothetical protein
MIRRCRTRSAASRAPSAPRTPLSSPTRSSEPRPSRPWCESSPQSFGAGKSRLGCRQAKRLGRSHAPISSETPDCERFEPRLTDDSCGPCGACCRQGFDRVDVRPRDVIRKRHPELVHEDAWGTHLPRPGGLCVALDVVGAHRCRVYADRPRSCREFAIGGDACLEARRRVGLSR